MMSSPKLWGVGLVCALAGAVAGSAVGSTPMLDRSTIGDLALVGGGGGGGSGANAVSKALLPDHYPLVTRQGTVPVAALSTRGLYSQKRYRVAMLYDDGEAAMHDAPYDPDADGSPSASGAPSWRAVASVPDGPHEVSVGPTVDPHDGEAKIIDVSTTLALN